VKRDDDLSRCGEGVSPPHRGRGLPIHFHVEMAHFVGISV